jgi:hypothetical protein
VVLSGVRMGRLEVADVGVARPASGASAYGAAGVAANGTGVNTFREGANGALAEGAGAELAE